MLAAADRFGATLAGGDTTSGPGPACVTVTALGEPMPGGPVTRGGARPGDVLAVTGRLGGSLRPAGGGRHLRPEPRLREIEWLLRLAGGGLRAAMDLSDGLAMDLPRLARESGVGAAVEAGRVPVSASALELARLETAKDARSGLARETAVRHALRDGEDFELLLALAPEAWEKVSAAWPPSSDGTRKTLAPVTRIGTFNRNRQIRLLWPDGRKEPLSGGYEHLFD